MARVELNEQEIEDVVGGAFVFYTNRDTGEQMCYSQGVGLYTTTSSSAKRSLTVMCAREENNGKSQQELTDMAIAAGYLVPYTGN